MVDLSRVSREALEVLAQWFLRQYPQHPVTGRIRAEAAAPEAEPECNYAGRCNSSRCPKHGKPPQPPPRTRALDDVTRALSILVEERKLFEQPKMAIIEALAYLRTAHAELSRPTPAESPAIAAAAVERGWMHVTVASPYTPHDTALILEAWRTLSDDARDAAWEQACADRRAATRGTEGKL